MYVHNVKNIYSLIQSSFAKGLNSILFYLGIKCDKVWYLRFYKKCYKINDLKRYVILFFKFSVDMSISVQTSQPGGDEDEEQQPFKALVTYISKYTIITTKTCN